jgi:ADP-L-glycero-D-manno-heptose 6-epimerase
MPNVLVTGDKGFIGSNLVAHLHESGIVAETFDLVTVTGGPYQIDRERSMDLLDSMNPDAIFHVGANSNTLDTDVNGMFFLNYEVTKWLVDWTFLNSKPFIYSSSAANFGVNGLFPSNTYGWSKFAAEDYVRKSRGVSLRYFNVYGPGEDHKGDMASFVNQAFRQVQSGGRVKLFPGEPKRDFVHVNDVCQANLHAFTTYSIANLGGGVFEVGSGQSHTFEEALEEFGLSWEYLPHSAIPAGYQEFTEAKPSKFLPGWKPKTSFRQGMSSYRKLLEEKMKN